jgi:hypothetical protein
MYRRTQTNSWPGLACGDPAHSQLTSVDLECDESSHWRINQLYLPIMAEAAVGEPAEHKAEGRP